MPTSKTVSAKGLSPVGVRVQDLARVGQLAEERLVALAPELLAEAYARRDGEPEVEQALSSVGRAWKQFDQQIERVTKRFDQQMERLGKRSASRPGHHKKSEAGGIWAGEAQAALIDSLVDLAGALEREYYLREEAVVPDVERGLAKAFGPAPAVYDTGFTDWKSVRKDAKDAAAGRG